MPPTPFKLHPAVLAACLGSPERNPTPRRRFADPGRKKGLMLFNIRPFLNGSTQTENEDPQPQVVVALGFLMTNCAPCKSSL